jgi:hypothetical protein
MPYESHPIATPGLFQSGQSFEAVVQHWAKARIDGPMQVIARFDEAAKQLIATGGLLQGLFFAVVAIGKWKNDFPFALWIVGAFFLPLLAMVFCAAKVICTVPLKMEAIDTYLLMQRASNPSGVSGEDLTDAMRRWCRTVDRIAVVKHRWLFAANLLFLVSSLVTLAMLLSLGFM